MYGMETGMKIWNVYFYPILPGGIKVHVAVLNTRIIHSERGKRYLEPNHGHCILLGSFLVMY